MGSEMCIRDRINALQAADYGLTVSEACGEAGIDRTCYYRWHQIEGFRRWWNDQTERYFSRMLPRVLSAIYKGAIEDGAGGNHADRKLFLERFDAGYAPKSRQEVAGHLDHAHRAENVLASLRDIQGRLGGDTPPGESSYLLEGDGADVIDVEAIEVEGGGAIESVDG